MNKVGIVQKLIGVLDEQNQVHYAMPLGDEPVPLNEFIGQTIQLEFTGNIACVACSRPVKKTYSQGYCYVCMTRLAQCDMCIMKPEQCHFHLGTCREPDWGEQHCMRDHFVYLSNASSVKVGITRAKNIPGRWIDQGATQALPIFKVKTRRISGLIEVAIKQHVADKTNWRKMLSGPAEPADLLARRDELIALTRADIDKVIAEFGEDSVTPVDETVVDINFPVLEYPSKIRSLNFDKNPLIHAKLVGIKGQYLIFDCGVINIRKFTGYELSVKVG